MENRLRPVSKSIIAELTAAHIRSLMITGHRFVFHWTLVSYCRDRVAGKDTTQG